MVLLILFNTFFFIVNNLLKELNSSKFDTLFGDMANKYINIFPVSFYSTQHFLWIVKKPLNTEKGNYG